MRQGLSQKIKMNCVESYCRVFVDEPEAKAAIVRSAIKRPATGETGRRSPEQTGTCDLLLALGTSVNKATPMPQDRKGKGMTAFFVRDPEIVAGLAPLLAMWSDPTTPGAELR